MKNTIGETYFETRPGRRLKLTIKAGGAICPQDGGTYETLLTTADGRMSTDTR